MRAEPGTFKVVKREWKDGETLELDVPDEESRSSGVTTTR